jgi:hypothetical protein
VDEFFFYSDVVLLVYERWTTSFKINLGLDEAFYDAVAVALLPNATLQELCHYLCMMQRIILRRIVLVYPLERVSSESYFFSTEHTELNQQF